MIDFSLEKEQIEIQEKYRDFADRYGIEIYADDASAAAKEFVKTVS